MTITYANPGYFYLLLLLIPIVAWYIWKNGKTIPSMRVSTTSTFKGIGKGYKTYLMHLPFILRMLAITAVIFALARPQSSDNLSNKNVEGINIVMALE